jgi:hypothetical protein
MRVAEKLDWKGLSSKTGLRLQLPSTNHQTLKLPLQSKSNRPFGNSPKCSMDIAYLHWKEDNIISANISEFVSSNKLS